MHAHTDGRQRTTGNSHLSPLLCGFQGLDSGHQAWQQALSLNEPSQQPLQILLKQAQPIPSQGRGRKLYHGPSSIKLSKANDKEKNM